MFESPVKQSQSPEAATVSSVLLVLTRGRDVSHPANAISAGYRKFFLPLSFSTLVWGDRL